MSWLPKGKYVGFIDTQHPDGLGICDSSGFVFKRKDLLRQMEWRGDRLAWTGFYVGRPYLDEPNAQLKPPHLKPDPYPLVDPRLPQGTLMTWETLTAPVWELTNYITWEQWGTYQDGFPALLPQIRLTNLQQGGFVQYPPLNIGYYPPLQHALPENERLSLLESARWGT